MTRVVLAALLVAVLAADAEAHEIGKTQATAILRTDGTYQVDVTVDPDALLMTLQAIKREPVLSNIARTERDARIALHANVFLEHVIVRFDGIQSRAQFQYLPASAFSDMAKVPSIARLTGHVPAGAREFAFANGLTMGSHALVLRVGEAQPETFWLDGPNPVEPISIAEPRAAATSTQIAKQYFGLGYTHILPKGLDHILFVVGIFLLSTRWRSVLLQVSTFTIAHSITLGLTMYGIVSLPARVVEPMIALSIAYVALENLFTTELKSWRLALVFSFGLLHGMGFAGVLRDLGLPNSQFLAALLTFNLGVEAGQLSVILIAFAVVAYWRANRVTYRRLVVQPASLAMTLTGLYWTVQRAFL